MDSKLVDFLNVALFALNIIVKIYLSLFNLYLDLAVLPIKIASISIRPVVGSVADCCIAVLTKCTAF